MTVERIGEGIFPEGTTAFAPGAQSQLVLFMFLTSMTAATQIILSRQLGVSRRMLAAPIGVSTIVVGEVLGRFGVAMVQGLFIVFLSALAFGVPWGDPLAAGMIVVVFALVGTGAAMVVGVFANDVDQAGSLGVMAGMLLGALGGAMVPLEIFPEPMHIDRLPDAAGLGDPGAPHRGAARRRRGRHPARARRPRPLRPGTRGTRDLAVPTGAVALERRRALASVAVSLLAAPTPRGAVADHSSAYPTATIGAYFRR